MWQGIPQYSPDSNFGGYLMCIDLIFPLHFIVHYMIFVITRHCPTFLPHIMVDYNHLICSTT